MKAREVKIGMRVIADGSPGIVIGRHEQVSNWWVVRLDEPESFLGKRVRELAYTPRLLKPEVAR